MQPLWHKCLPSQNTFCSARGSLRGHFPSLFCPFLLLSGNSNYVPWRKRAPTAGCPPSLLKAVCTQRAVSVSRCQRLYQVIIVKWFLSFAMRQLERCTHSFVSRSAILANLAEWLAITFTSLNCCMSTLRLVHYALLLTPACWKSNNTNARLMAFALSPHIWNSLPQDLRHCSTLSSFKAKLKTFLFSQYFYPN